MGAGAIMSQQQNRQEEATGKAVREFALGRAASINKYGALLTRFGKNEIGPEEFAEQSVRMYIEEGIQYFNDSVALGSAYFGVFSNLARTATKRAADAAPAPAARTKK
jgi:hypothetical protein